MPNYFFTSDTHFGHENMIKYSNRPFSSSEEMDEILISNWNELVKPNDIIYHLGDFALPNRKIYKTDEEQLRYVYSIIDRLNGKVHIVFGSHDRHARLSKHKFHTTYSKNTMNEIQIGSDIIYISHCPMLSWEKKAHGSLHFFGHVHSSPTKEFRCSENSCDVGVDAWGYKPVSIEDAIKMAKSKEHKLEFGNSLYDQYVVE